MQSGKPRQEPEAVFRHVWRSWPQASLCGRGQTAYRMAVKALPGVCKLLSQQGLLSLLDEVEEKTAYYTYYLELLHAEMAAAEQELAARPTAMGPPDEEEGA